MTEYRDQWFAERTQGEFVTRADRPEPRRIDSFLDLKRDFGQLYGAGQTDSDDLEDVATTGVGETPTELVDQFFAT